MSAALGVLLPGFSGPELPGWLRARLRDGLAGVCLFAGNIESPEQLVDLTEEVRAANPAALVALDEEGGDVTRLHAAGGSPYPGNAWLGRRDDPSLTAVVARCVAEDLRAVGANLDLAPCLDVNSDPDNPVIGVRSFGADARVVARHGAAWVEACQRAGVAACVKHFPGHGDTSVDSHLGLPRLDRDLDALLGRELAPFVAAVGAGAAAVMTGHLLLPRLDPSGPATFSRVVAGELLRRRLGFAGVLVTDALDMAGAGGPDALPVATARSLEAGCDLLCLGAYTTEAQLDEVARAAASVPRPRVREAARRVATLAERVRVVDRPVPAAGPGLDLDAATLASGFEVAPRARTLLATGRRWTFARVGTSADDATGTTPWGPFPSLSGHVDVDETTRSTDLPAGPLALVGRGNHRHAWVRSLADACRRERDDVLVVDMGWPSPDLAYADVATYGASVLLGRGLLHLLLAAHPRR